MRTPDIISRHEQGLHSRMMAVGLEMAIGQASEPPHLATRAAVGGRVKACLGLRGFPFEILNLDNPIANVVATIRSQHDLGHREQGPGLNVVRRAEFVSVEVPMLGG